MEWNGDNLTPVRHCSRFRGDSIKPCGKPKIPGTEALLYVENTVYVQLKAQYWYHIEATIEDMEKYLEVFHRQKDVLCWFCNNPSTKQVSEASKI